MSYNVSGVPIMLLIWEGIPAMHVDFKEFVDFGVQHWRAFAVIGIGWAAILWFANHKGNGLAEIKDPKVYDDFKGN